MSSQLTPAASTFRIGHVALVVRDLDRMTRFYNDVVGLRELDRDGSRVRLGTARTPMLELRYDAEARLGSPREAGLYHTAFLLPTRADLGRWAVHTARYRFPIDGASDHTVSEAIYLSDPEGNGIEVYSDKPRDTWTWSDGQIRMAVDPLDTDGLMRAAGTTEWDGVPVGTTVGHVHLQVGAVAAAESFYGGVLGVPVTGRYPGATFFGADGYHHHVAANDWNSHNAGLRTGPATGLAEVGITIADGAHLDAIHRRAGKAGVAATWQGATLSMWDPWGTLFKLNGPAS